MAYDHFCPKLSPNSKVPNMRRQGCAGKIKLKIPGCPTCPSGIGYVAPVKKVITERLWRNPHAKKPAERVRKPRPIVERLCACGAKVEKLKSLCNDCREVKRKNVIIRARQKTLQRRIDINLKVIAELAAKLGKEYKRLK